MSSPVAAATIYTPDGSLNQQVWNAIDSEFHQADPNGKRCPPAPIKIKRRRPQTQVEKKRRLETESDPDPFGVLPFLRGEVIPQYVSRTPLEKLNWELSYLTDDDERRNARQRYIMAQALIIFEGKVGRPAKVSECFAIWRHARKHK